jgi:hypothetical protein
MEGSLPSHAESEGDYAASAAMLEGYEVVKPLAP